MGVAARVVSSGFSDAIRARQIARAENVIGDRFLRQSSINLTEARNSDFFHKMEMAKLQKLSTEAHPMAPERTFGGDDMMKLIGGREGRRNVSIEEAVSQSKDDIKRIGKGLPVTQAQATQDSLGVMRGAQNSGFAAFSRGIDQSSAVAENIERSAAKQKGWSSFRANTYKAPTPTPLTGSGINFGASGDYSASWVKKLAEDEKLTKKASAVGDVFNARSGKDATWLDAIKVGANSVINNVDRMYEKGGLTRKIATAAAPGLVGALGGAAIGFAGNIIAPNNIGQDSFVKGAFMGAATGMALAVAGHGAGAAGRFVKTQTDLDKGFKAAWMAKPLGIVEKASQSKLVMGALTAASFGSSVDFNFTRPINAGNY